MTITKVVLVDDHDLVRTGIKLMLTNLPSVQVIGEAKSGEEATELVHKAKPDLVLMDINMPGIGGLEATRKLLRSHPELKILIISVYNDELLPARLLQAGATGYLTKEASMEEMVRAIKAVSLGQRYISPVIASQLALATVDNRSNSPLSALSERELQILLMVSRGMTPREIAKQLHLSPKTVNSYRYRIFSKLDVHSDVEMILVAIRYGLIENKSGLFH